MAGFIYDKGNGACIARIDDNGRIFPDAKGKTARQVATVDHAGNVYGLENELVGHLSPLGRFDGGSEAFKRLLEGTDG